MMFRSLRADEVECRVAQCTEKGVSLLLYKDARCDMNILDETVGQMFWQRHHSRNNANCVVSIFCKELDQWIDKEDTGTESNTEAEKGLASDSFKRACFNWGIGRELYTAPFIWVNADKCKIVSGRNGKPACYDNFEVSNMAVENGRITALSVDCNGRTVFTMGDVKKTKEPDIKCECCGENLIYIKDRKGNTLSPKDVQKISVDRFGKTLCPGCQRKAMEDIKKAREELKDA